MSNRKHDDNNDNSDFVTLLFVLAIANEAFNIVGMVDNGGGGSPDKEIVGNCYMLPTGRKVWVTISFD